MNKKAFCTAALLTGSLLMLVGLPGRAQSPAAIPQAVPAPPPQAAPTAAPTATVELPTLRKGMNGGAVRLLQNILVAQGLLKSGEITGYFGDTTERVVKNFQRQCNLSADGVVGAATWRMLGGTLWD